MVDKNKEIVGKLKLDLLHGFGSLSNRSLKNSIAILDSDDFRRVVFPLG